MDTVKKQKIILLVEFVVMFLFLFFIGSGDVISPVYGDINVLDEGQYGAWLMHMLAGQHLYKDVYAAYGPLYIYPIYLFAKLFSPSVFLIRLVYTVINVFIAVIVVQLVISKIKIPYYLQLFCIALLLILPGYSMRQGMGFISLLLVYKALEEKKYLWSFLAGISLATTFLTSSDIGLFSILVCLLYFTYTAVFIKSIKNFLKKIWIFLFSYLLIFFIFYLWSNSEGWFFAYINTILSDLKIYSSIDTAIGRSFPNAFYLMPHSLSLLQWLKYILSQQILLYWIYLFYISTFIYFFIKILLNNFKKEDNLSFMITFFGFLLSTILIGRTDHLNFILAPVVILFVYFLNILVVKFKSSTSIDKYMSLFLIIVIVLFSIRLVSIYRPHFVKILTIPRTIADNKTEIPFVGPVAISQKQTKFIQEIQYFIKTHTNQKDTIYFFSNDPMLYLLVDKNNPTKYDLPEVANSIDKRMEVLHELMIKKPKYIFYDVTSFSVDGVSNYSRLPEVTAFIKKYYTKTRLDNFIIYTRLATK